MTRWFKSGFECASPFKLSNGEEILAFDALHLIAAKIEAFGDRGDDDWLSSQDVEDIVTLLDGRGSIFDELSQRSEVVRFAVEWLRKQ